MFCDNDASAYGLKPRRAYERMLAAVETRSIDAIVTWHNDRLHRSPKELEAFIDLVERRGVRLAVVTGGDYDLTTPDGRLSARIVGPSPARSPRTAADACGESTWSSPSWAGPPATLGWGVRSEDEREYVREAARRVLKGDGLMTIARDWNTEGVPGASGGPWTAPTLRRVPLSSRIAGLGQHGVDPSGKTLGDLSPAVWAAALDRQTWDQIRAVLLNPDRNTNVRKATRYLLTGLIHCGGCGAGLFSRPRNHTRRYLCAGRRPGHQLGILPDAVDELVRDFVLGLLTTPSVREALLARAGAGDDATMGAHLMVSTGPSCTSNY